jgi:hypothetical protein
MKESASDLRRGTEASYRPTGDESSRKPHAGRHGIVGDSGWPALSVTVRREIVEPRRKTSARSREDPMRTPAVR